MLQLALDSLGGLADLADDGVGGHPHVVEARRRRSAGSGRRSASGAIETPGGVGWHEHLGEPVAGAAGDEEVAGLRRPTRPGRFTPSSTTSPPSTADVERDVAEAVVRRRLAEAPRGDRVPGEQVGEHARVAASPAALSAAATTLVGTSGPGAAWRPNS